MRKKDQTQKTLMLVTALVAFVLMSNFVVSNWHCCKSSGCDDCDTDFFGCNCELREKLGFEVCEECKDAGCGNDEGVDMCSLGSH